MPDRLKEVSAVFLLALALLLAFMLWAPGSMSGVLGSFFSQVVFGFIGTCAYILPFLLAYLGIELFKEEEKGASFARRNCFFLLLLASALLISALSLDVQQVQGHLGGPSASAQEALKLFWRGGQDATLLSASKVWTGGFVGSLSVYALQVLCGYSGALIICTAMFLALLTLAFDLSYTTYFKKTAEGVRETGRRINEAQRAARARYEEARREAARKREDALEKASAAESESAESLQEGNEQKRDPAQIPEPEIEAWPQLHSSPAEEQARQLLEEAWPSLWPGLKSERPESEEQFSRDDVLPSEVQAIRPVHLSVSAASSELLSCPEGLTKAEDSAIIPEPEAPMPEEEKAAVVQAEEFNPIELKNVGEEQRVTDRAHWDETAAAQANGKALSQVDLSRAKAQVSILQTYVPPPFKILNEEDPQRKRERDDEQIRLMGEKLEETLQSFGVDAHVSNYISGPTISRYELVPGPGVKVSKIVNLSDDIALSLAAIAVRIEAPIPGKSAIGIEIPNKKTEPVLLRALLEEPEFQCAESPLTAVLGRDIQGKPILCDLAKMPHLLIAGATGSGKSVCINSILISLLYRTGPENLRLLMIDPKVVELSIYNGIPHLLQPVVTEPKKAFGALNWAVNEMTRRYGLFADHQVRDFKAFNALVERQTSDEELVKLPLILLVIDELSDLMQTTASEVEAAIARLTAMARAAGIHLIIATQRPSVDVITGTIKSNIPSRISFAVSSQVDSRTILDSVGAEKLLGKGDMLYNPQSASKPIRGQGAFITDAEVERVITYLKNLYPQNYDSSVYSAIETAAIGKAADGGSSATADDVDELFDEALRLVIETGYASTSLLQRRLNLGYPRASRLIDQLHDKGYIGPFEGSKPRKVLIKLEDYLSQEAE